MEKTAADIKIEIIENIREWIKIDNEIRQLKLEEKKRKGEQKDISFRLMGLMEQNNVNEFDVKDSKITHVKKNIKKPITQKMLLHSLSNYYENDEETAIKLGNYILDNREEKTVEIITRKMKNA